MAGNVDINGGIWREATVHSNFHDAVSQDESRRRKEKTECKAEAGTIETVHKSTWNDLPALMQGSVMSVLLQACVSVRPSWQPTLNHYFGGKVCLDNKGRPRV